MPDEISEQDEQVFALSNLQVLSVGLVSSGAVSPFDFCEPAEKDCEPPAKTFSYLRIGRATKCQM